MNRRSFLRRALIGAAGVAVASKIPFEKLNLFAEPVQATIGPYVDYCNFSDFVVETSIDEQVQMAATELGRRAGQSINELWAATLG